ncbi:MAG: 3-deoxy-7-phosphoheptulonate synthase [Verrucomicrobiota bacterium]|nr:3-deoxy-7-phosphoheptulonate synthase [Verrucomicrobiota bacterium]
MGSYPRYQAKLSEKKEEKNISNKKKIDKNAPLYSLDRHPEPSIVQVGNSMIGEKKNFTVMAGPCSVEGRHQLISTAKICKDEGADILRGGAFKPRSSPYSFQGLGEEGVKLLCEAKKQFGMPIVTEVIGVEELEIVAEYADILQIGARNMQNYVLLKEIGKLKIPVLLKRGMMATLQELLMSAEYILDKGNSNVILCERGIRTFETATRNTLDLSAVPYLKQHTHLPVIVDPSHGTGVLELVEPMAKAALAVGADGIMIEVHFSPSTALSDGYQSLDAKGFKHLMKEIKRLKKIF